MIRWTCGNCQRLMWFWERSCRPCQEAVLEAERARQIAEDILRHDLGRKKRDE